MKRETTLCLAGILWLCASACPAQEIPATEGGIPPEAIQRITEYARQTMDWSGTPGLSLTVTSRERILFEAALGNADQKLGRQVEAGTLFQIGSVSKTFTALALLSLAEEGKLDLDEPVEKYLPWFSVHSAFGPITVRHLLTNTAGIPANRDDFPSTPYMAVALREQMAAWAPGTQFLYSNVGYQVLSVLIETVAHKPWGEVVRERILDPLGMTDTEPAITFANRERQAIGYIPADPTRPAYRSRALAEAPFFEYAIGDGCIAATATDMAAFVRMMLNEGWSANGRIVSENAFTQFIKPGVTDEAGSGYGLGIEVDRHDGQFVLLHWGGMVGHHSLVLADVHNGYGLVILANGPNQIYELGAYARAVLHAVNSGTPLPDLPANPDPQRIKKAADYAGEYKTPGHEALRFSAEGDALWIEASGRKAQLERVGEDSFYCLDPALDQFFFHFERNADGQVVTVTHGPRWWANPQYKGPFVFDSPAECNAYTGTYHSPSPWFPGFSVFIRRGELWAVTFGGGETTAGAEIRLTPLGAGVFRPAAEPTPDRVVFSELINGKAWRVSWSGHQFYWAGPTPLD